MYYKWQMSILHTDYATYSICPFSAWLGPVWNGHFPKPARANQKPAQFARRPQAYGYLAYIFTTGYLAIMYEYGKLCMIKSLKCWTVRIMAMLDIKTALHKMLICVYFPVEQLLYESHLVSYDVGEGCHSWIIWFIWM